MRNEMDDVDMDNAIDGLGMVNGMIEDLELERLAVAEQEADREFRQSEGQVIWELELEDLVDAIMHGRAK